MLIRVFAFFLALALVGASFAAQEESSLFASTSNEPTRALGSDTSPTGSLDGWGDDHPFDGQPAQAQAETLADQPGLLQPGAYAHPPVLTMTRPAPYASAALMPPYLDGPQRPPRRATTLVA